MAKSKELAEELVQLERYFQETRWGLEGTCAGMDPWDHHNMTVLTEEVGEAATELNDRESILNLLLELNQVSAVSRAWMEGILYRNPDLFKEGYDTIEGKINECVSKRRAKSLLAPTNSGGNSLL